MAKPRGDPKSKGGGSQTLLPNLQCLLLSDVLPLSDSNFTILKIDTLDVEYCLRLVLCTEVCPDWCPGASRVSQPGCRRPPHSHH